MLNIGCGDVWHPNWVNFDVVPRDPVVRKLDIQSGLPFEDGSVDVCYSSHVLEHLTIEAGSAFVRECHRVLRHRGIIRIVVPDLENIVREYLRLLEKVVAGKEDRVLDYHWMKLELIDQLVRDHSGGEMGRYLRQGRIPNREFVRSRIGTELDAIIGERCERSSLWQRLKAKPMTEVLGQLRNSAAGAVLRLIGGAQACRSLEIGRFRLSGEVHRWMHDRYSLPRLLEENGFSEARVCRPTESGIEGFNNYSLDVVDGDARKPDSLFVEALKE